MAANNIKSVRRGVDIPVAWDVHWHRPKPLRAPPRNPNLAATVIANRDIHFNHATNQSKDQQDQTLELEDASIANQGSMLTVDEHTSPAALAVTMIVA
jgi:hypothetical protein